MTGLFRLRRHSLLVDCCLPQLLQLLLLLLLLLLPQSAVGTLYNNHSNYYNNYNNNHQHQLVQSQLCNEDWIQCDAMNAQMQTHARALLSMVDGPVPVLVLLLRFADHADRALPPPEQYDVLFNADGRHDTFAPTGSVKSWLRANSYDQFHIEATVLDWQLTDETEGHTSYNKSGIDVRFKYAFYPLLDQLEASGFDFTKFDANGDGLLDNLVVLHSGYPAEIGGLDCETDAPALERIWSHALAVSQDNWVSPTSGIMVSAYVVSSALRGTCRGEMAKMSVITHEYIHTLGLPDLVDPSWVGKGLGDWDIMANAHGVNYAQEYPAHLSPWSKLQLGWVTPKEIVYNELYHIAASETSNDIYIISEPFPDGEYLLIENRQPILWDALLWDGGILIWHIDDKKRLQTDPGYPGQEGWPGNGNHYQIALEQADRNYDLERGRNSGDAGDYYTAGKSYGVGPEHDQAQVTEFEFYPNSNSYQDGAIQQTGLRLYDFSESGMVMTFRVQGLASAPPSASPSAVPTTTPMPSNEPTVPPTVAPTNPPTIEPTRPPTVSPTTALPTTVAPTAMPTFPPTTGTPTTRYPTQHPTLSPIPPPPSPTPFPTENVVLLGNIFDRNGPPSPFPTITRAPIPPSTLLSSTSTIPNGATSGLMDTPLVGRIDDRDR